MFVLSKQEVACLTPQIAASIPTKGGRRVPPFAFTEHGICMLSSILNSERAIDVNIAIVRTFVKLRKILNSDSELEKRLSELESQCEGKFKLVFDAIRELMSS